jgi:hypothetical protein
LLGRKRMNSRPSRRPVANCHASGQRPTMGKIASKSQVGQ